MTSTALNRGALDYALLDVLLPQQLVTPPPTGNYYTKNNRPIWPIYGPEASYLLILKDPN